MNKPSDALAQTVEQLAGRVDYWMRRAIEAEDALKREREDQIRQCPELWESYTKMLGLLGAKPAKREAEIS